MHNECGGTDGHNVALMEINRLASTYDVVQDKSACPRWAIAEDKADCATSLLLHLHMTVRGIDAGIYGLESRIGVGARHLSADGVAPKAERDDLAVVKGVFYDDKITQYGGLSLCRLGFRFG